MIPQFPPAAVVGEDAVIGGTLLAGSVGVAALQETQQLA